MSLFRRGLSRLAALSTIVLAIDALPAVGLAAPLAPFPATVVRRPEKTPQ